jgi:hypothetical protein
MDDNKAIVSYDESEDALSTYVNVGGKSINLLVGRNALTRVADEAISTVAGTVVSLVRNTADVYTATIKITEEAKTKIVLMNQYGQILREELGPPIVASTAAQRALEIARNSGLDPEIQKRLEEKIMNNWQRKMEEL